jgi:hypothetical protein
MDDLRPDLAAGVMNTHVDVFVGPKHDLVHTSLVLTGFCELASRRAISLRYRVARGGDAWLTGDPMVIVFDVHGAETTRVAIDLRDGEGISEPIIDRVRWYFKRAFHPPELEALGPARSAGMRPFGLNYGCRSLRSTARLLAAVGGPIALTGRDGLQRLRSYLGTPPPSAFEKGPETPVEQWVHFQTRLWPAAEAAPGEADIVNVDRVNMVRALKRAFGKRFIGGVMATDHARRHFPDDLTPHPSKYIEYLRLKQRCLIGVYTRGLEHSLAFKLGETIAASQCLVSVPLRYGLPAPLEVNRHYLAFETVDDCVAACQRLFDDPALARSMRQANHDYYVRAIEPAAHIERVLDLLG